MQNKQKHQKLFYWNIWNPEIPWACDINNKEVFWNPKSIGPVMALLRTWDTKPAGLSKLEYYIHIFYRYYRWLKQTVLIRVTNISHVMCSLKSLKTDNINNKINNENRWQPHYQLECVLTQNMASQQHATEAPVQSNHVMHGWCNQWEQ